MKKYILLISLIAGSFFFSACENTKTDPVGDAGTGEKVSLYDYAITNYTSEVEVFTVDTVYPIDFTLSKYGVPLQGETVSVKVFNDKYGSMVESFVTTNKNGKGTFRYLSPSTFQSTGTTIYIAYAVSSESNDDSGSGSDDTSSDSSNTFTDLLEAPVRINFN